MKEFIEKLIDRLGDEYLSQDMRDWNNAILRAVEIVEELAEEYINTSTDISTKQQDLSTRIADDLSAVLKEAKSMGCKEVKYFHHIPLGNVEIVVNALRAYKQGWIPCSERLPDEIGRYIVALKDGRSLEAIYDNISKRFIMYEHEVIAWQPLPDPYNPEQKEIPTKHYEERFNRVV